MIEVWQSVATLSTPVTAADLARIDAARTVLHLELPLTATDFEAVAGLLEARPELVVRLHRAGGEPLQDLEALAHLPTLRRLQLDTAPGLRSLDGLRHVPGLAQLFVSRMDKPVSLRPLEALTALRRLTLVGNHRDIDAVGAVRTLEDLTLRSVSRPKLGILRPLDRLKALDLKLGSGSDLEPVADLRGLEYLEVWRVQGLRDVSAIGHLPALGLLFLQALGRVDALPDLSGCAALWGVRLESLKAVTDLRPVLAAPALDQLMLLDMPQLRWEHVAPAARHPRLRAALVGTGSVRRNAEIEARLGLARAAYVAARLRWPF